MVGRISISSPKLEDQLSVSLGMIRRALLDFIPFLED
jgi:hypothetical protein